MNIWNQHIFLSASLGKGFCVLLDEGSLFWCGNKPVETTFWATLFGEGFLTTEMVRSNSTLHCSLYLFFTKHHVGKLLPQLDKIKFDSFLNVHVCHIFCSASFPVLAIIFFHISSPNYYGVAVVHHLGFC